MKKRLLALLILNLLFLLLVILVWWAPWKKEHIPLDLFQIKDTSRIHEIILADKMGNLVKLRKTNKGWILNDSLEAEPEAVKYLLKTLHRQRVVQEASPKAKPNILKEMQVNVIRVIVKDPENKVLLDFYVDGATPDNMGTYMMLSGDSTPYVVMLPGHIGVLSPQYKPDPESWRKRSIISLNPNQIYKVSVEYLYGHEVGFELTLKNNSFSLKPITKNSSPPDTAQKINKSAIPTYLEQFKKVGVLAFLPPQYMDSAMANPEYARLSITTTDGTTYTFRIWLHPIDERSRLLTDPISGKPLLFDLDRIYVWSDNKKELYLCHWNVWGRLLRTYQEFFLPVFPPYREPPRFVEQD